MSELEDLRRENRDLREMLELRARDARQALEAVARHEIDAVVETTFSTPVLLHAAQEKLRESERLLRAIFDGALDAMLLADDKGNYLAANAAACELFDVPRERLLGRNVAEFAAPVVAMSKTWESFARRGELRGLFVLKRPDGTCRDLEYAATSNVVPGLHLSVLRDVTERLSAETALRRTEEQLRQSQKMEAVGKLAGGIAHDFNNLLSVIITYAGFLLETLADGDPQREDAEEIRTAGERAAELTTQLLAFSRQQVLAPAVVDVNHVLASMEKLLRRTLGEDIEFILQLHPQLDLVKADRGKLEQVLMNLVVNARDAMPRGGRLTVETTNIACDEAFLKDHPGFEPGAYVMLSVRDNGEGMDDATRERIFEPFFTTKTVGRGTGLGLATVFGIVEQSGGHVWAESEPGKGATFRVCLPRTTETGRNQTALEPTSASQTGTETVLLVEDDEQVRQLARTVLQRGGYHVLEAANAGDALLACEQHKAPIELLLTDVVMPRMSGQQLAERLTPMQPAMRVLFMSGYTDDAVVRHGVTSDGLAFLQKPLRAETLLRKVREVLDAQPTPTT